MYFVKTRNWYCNKIVFEMLNATKKIGVQRGDSYSDGDGKFYLKTKNLFKAWYVWMFFMLLSPFSGGWTYILRPGKKS